MRPRLLGFVANAHPLCLDLHYALPDVHVGVVIFAVVAFVLSAVSAPLIFDRGIDTKTAMLTSVRAVAASPATMVVWAVLIAVLTAIGFATFLLGLVIILPLLGHATWHAYRDLVA